MMKCQKTGLDGDDSTCTGIPFDVDDTMCKKKAKSEKEEEKKSELV